MLSEIRHRWTILPHALNQAFGDLQRRAEARCEPPYTVTTGLSPIDAVLGPMKAGDLVLVAGAKSTLRSAFLQRCALSCAEHYLVAVFCLGQSVSRTSFQMIAAESGVPLSLLDRGQLDRDCHWPAVADAVENHHQRRMALLDLSRPSPEELRTALLKLRREYGDIALVIVDAVELTAQGDSDPLVVLTALARELEAPVLAGVTPATAQSARAAGLPSAVIHLPEIGDEAVGDEPRPELGFWNLTVRVDADRAGVSATLRLDYEPHCCAWDVPVRAPSELLSTADAHSSPPVSRREGKELDAVYAAACCALLHEVGLSHYWDGKPHGPGRAWELPQNERLSDEQRLVVRVALDIWDNQGGVLLRDLRKLPASMVADVGELIADTSSARGPVGWVERRLGQDWRHWMAEGRWEQLLGTGWRDLVGRLDQAPPVS